MKRAIATVAVLFACGAFATPFSFEQRMNLKVDGVPWLGTVNTPIIEADEDLRYETFKVYTHLYDFEGNERITKGSEGQFSHHRGLFIGWNHTDVGDTRYDTWHMGNSSQNHIAWLDLYAGDDSARQVQEIHWSDEDGVPFVREVRTIEARPGDDGVRVIDFTSELTALHEDIELRGDSHHAGMQIRLHEEVGDHADTTEYILQPGGEEIDNDEVLDAWWVICGAVVNDQRYWVAHMTPPDHSTGVPMYSIRRYARFGAFFEPDLQHGEPKTFTFRILVSEDELDIETVEAHYEAYSAE